MAEGSELSNNPALNLIAAVQEELAEGRNVNEQPYTTVMRELDWDRVAERMTSKGSALSKVECKVQL